MTRPRPGFADDLDATLAEAFRLLSRGVADRRSAFHTPCLGSVGADGRPRLRTVVLRGFDPQTRTLRIHTDRRSAKAAEILANPWVMLHAYDPAAQVQIRLAGKASLHAEDAVADAAWAASRPFSRLCYAIQEAPGTPVPAPPPAPRDAAGGRAHFAALLIAFDRLEWLWLCAEGHRRARFAWDGEGRRDACWLVP
ncbi:MAG: pyridoxamine 5'-phosphate oxidase family protein [Acetobacteraceae bacterium]|nr:pyridoxamine 5'-phosphate oxidase family protein [Acetobacteraceae bacterium]